MAPGTAPEGNDETPSWLNAEFFAKLLDCDESQVDVERTEWAVPKGDNYSSVLHRVLLRAQGHRHHLIVKSLPRGDVMQKFVKESGIFAREVNMYEAVLPQVERIGGTRLSARLLPCTRPYTVVLEDLRVEGYRMADRRRGMDIEHCTLALEALARLHAVSVVMHDRDPGIIEQFTEPFFLEEKREEFEKFSEPGIKNLASMIGKWPGFERFEDKLLDWGKRCIKTLIDLFGDTNCPRVLNHGDFWVNNMMFKYDAESGAVSSVRLVDFQVMRYASPAIDLHYFFATSLSDDVRSRHKAELLRVYLDQLRRTLGDAGADPDFLTTELLQQEMRRTSVFALHAALTITPIVLAEPKDSPDFSKITEDAMDPVIMDGAYGGSRFRDVLQDLMLSFEKDGVL